MDIELLRNFLEIARLGSMTKAASSLHISQPTLSVQMKSLEEVLGRKLFRKEGRDLVMTEEGELLERRAADIIGLTDKTLSEFRALSDSLGGDVRIGCAESVLIDHLALAVKKIKKKRPFLRCHITSGDTAIVTSILEQGLIDFAIIVEPPDLDRYDSIQIPGVDTWCAVIPEDSPLAAKKSLTFDYIKNEPIIMSKQSFLADLPRWCGSRRDELTIFGYLNLFYNGTRFVKITWPSFSPSRDLPNQETALPSVPFHPSFPTACTSSGKSARSSLPPRGTSWKSFGKMQKKNLSMNNKKGL